MTEREWGLKALALLDALAQRKLLAYEDHQTISCMVGRQAMPYECMYCLMEAAQQAVREYPREKA